MNAVVGVDAWTPSTAQRQVRDAVAEIFGVTPLEVIGHSRRRDLVDVRRTAMWVVRQCFPGLSYPMIGRLFGARDHSTVIHGVRKIECRRERDAAFAELTEAMRDGFGIRRAGLIVDDELRSRVEMVIARVEAANRPAPSAIVETIKRDILPRNDFSEDDSDGALRKSGSDALLKALKREGQVCR